MPGLPQIQAQLFGQARTKSHVTSICIHHKREVKIWMGGETKQVLRVSKADWHSDVHLNLAPLRFRAFRGSASRDKFETNLWYQPAMPTNRWTAWGLMAQGTFPQHCFFWIHLDTCCRYNVSQNFEWWLEKVGFFHVYSQPWVLKFEAENCLKFTSSKMGSRQWCHPGKQSRCGLSTLPRSSPLNSGMLQGCLLGQRAWPYIDKIQKDKWKWFYPCFAHPSSTASIHFWGRW